MTPRPGERYTATKEGRPRRTYHLEKREPRLSTKKSLSTEIEDESIRLESTEYSKEQHAHS